MKEYEVQEYMADHNTNNIKFVGFFSTTITGKETYTQVDVDDDSAPTKLLNILNDISQNATITQMSCPTQYTKELGYYDTLYFFCRERLPSDSEDEVLTQGVVSDIILNIVLR